MKIENVVDIHIHGGPSHAPRKLLDHEVAMAAADAGMYAIVLKCHEGSTVERALLAQAVVKDRVKVFGGIALNAFIGGLNPFAVFAAIKMGARIVWMPTFTSKNHLAYERKNGFLVPELSIVCQDMEGTSVLDSDGQLLPAAIEIIDMIAAADIILCLGHLSVEESKAVVQVARKRNVKKIILSHPENPITPVSLEDQKWFVKQGVVIERCVINVLEGRTAWAQLAADISATGTDNNLISTDLGQQKNIAPVDGMNLAYDSLNKYGVAEADLAKMMSAIPISLLGI